MRETRSQLSVFEVVPGTDQVEPCISLWSGAGCAGVGLRLSFLYLLDLGVCFKGCWVLGLLTIILSCFAL